MYNYRQHDISEATAKRLESADARIDALEAEIREIYRDSKEWYDEEAESLYEALDKAWDAFRWTPPFKTSAHLKGAFLLRKHFNTLNRERSMIYWIIKVSNG